MTFVAVFALLAGSYPAEAFPATPVVAIFLGLGACVVHVFRVD